MFIKYHNHSSQKSVFSLLNTDMVLEFRVDIPNIKETDFKTSRLVAVLDINNACKTDFISSYIVLENYSITAEAIEIFNNLCKAIENGSKFFNVINN